MLGSLWGFWGEGDWPSASMIPCTGYSLQNSSLFTLLVILTCSFANGAILEKLEYVFLIVIFCDAKLLCHKYFKPF